jgi:putative ABC transport system permease protein
VIARIASHLYAMALLAFPASHRRTYGPEMRTAFADQLREAHRRGAAAATQFAFAAFNNAVAAGLGARWHHYRSNPATTSAFSRLDLILAWRMLIRYPGFSAISVFGIAMGIAVAAGAFTIVHVLTEPQVPLAESPRLVSLFNRDVASNNRESRLLFDFNEWRHLTSLDEIGIARTASRNLVIDGPAEPINVAEISASAFRIAGVSALRGRYLLPEDEAPSAENVVVIGYVEWVRRFGGAADTVGRTVELGGVTHTIVGVMPDGFGFPVSHSFWVPWRVDTTAFAPRTGPTVHVFGRLSPTTSIETAQAELAAIGERATAALPETHRHLRPRVVPYTYVFNDLDDPDNAVAMRAIQFALVMLLIVICVNVAILVYARTATRQAEIAVRGALGASRRRIIAQLFVEALVLAGLGAAIGAVALTIALPQLESAILATTGGSLPFWIRFEVPSAAIVYTAALALLAAAIVGVLPAVKATGVDVRTRLQTLSAGGGSDMQMGALWTLLIVAQVGLTVALLPSAIFYTWDGLRLRTGDAGFASKEFLSATLAMDRSLEPPTADAAAAFAVRYGAAAAALDARLRESSAIRDVTFSITTPGQELAMVIEAEALAPPLDAADYNIVEGTKAGHLVRYNRVTPNFFDAFEVPVMLGRGFAAQDAGTDRVVISRTLATTVFGAANPLGQRIKYVGRSREAIFDGIAMDRWLEIIGVVANFPANDVHPIGRVYHPVDTGNLYPATIAVRVREGDPEAAAVLLRDTSVAVNARLQVRDISTADIIVRREQGMFRMIGVTVGLVMTSVIILTAAGIYALMSFTVTRRRREIGIRAALGANRNRLLAGIFARAAAQLMAGAAVGLVASLGVEQILEGEMFQGRGTIILPIVIALMSAVGLLAALGPARRGLRIQPIEALREE